MVGRDISFLHHSRQSSNDAKLDISRAYGVFDEQSVIARRTTFVIDREGIVQQVFMAQEALGPAQALEACALPPPARTPR